MENANLNRAYMIQSRFEGSRLVATHMERAYLLETKLDRADLTGARLAKARLHGSQLTYATLLAADLREAQFQAANMGWVEFNQPGSGSNKVILIALEAADLTGANLEFAHLEGADLRGVKGLTQEQLNKACLDDKTRLPAGLITPLPCAPNAEYNFYHRNYLRQLMPRGSGSHR